MPHSAHEIHSPERTLREIARRAISSHTAPGELVIDPMCGTGDVLVEAIKANRMVIGVEYERYWADIAGRRVEAASGSFTPRGFGAVVHGDPLNAARTLGSDVRGRASLVFISPHNGTARSIHDPNLTCGDLDDLLTSIGVLLGQCRELLRPDGYLVVVTVPVKREDGWVTLRSAVHRHAVAAGFRAVDITDGAVMSFARSDDCESLPKSRNDSASEDRRH